MARPDAGKGLLLVLIDLQSLLEVVWLLTRTLASPRLTEEVEKIIPSDSMAQEGKPGG